MIRIHDDVIPPSHLVQKLWNYCNILRDDGLSYQSLHKYMH